MIRVNRSDAATIWVIPSRRSAGSTVGSSPLSAVARIAASGVRISCDASATNRRCRGGRHGSVVGYGSPDPRRRADDYDRHDVRDDQGDPDTFEGDLIGQARGLLGRQVGRDIERGAEDGLEREVEDDAEHAKDDREQADVEEGESPPRPLEHQSSPTRRPKSVAGTPHRLDQAISTTVVDLAPKAPDVDLDDIRLGDEVGVPEGIEQPILGEQLAGVAGKELEEGEFAGGQPNRPAGAFTRSSAGSRTRSPTVIARHTCRPHPPPSARSRARSSATSNGLAR